LGRRPIDKVFAMTDDHPTLDTSQPTPPAGPADSAPPPVPAAESAGEPPAESPDTAEEAREPEKTPEPEKPSNKRWYVVKVQSGREESIKQAIEKGVKREGLEEYFGQIIIPVEKVTEMSKGKKVVRERKLYPGYLMVEVDFNDRILYLFRETSGVGDFVGGGVNRPPPPMAPEEVARMLGDQGRDKGGIKLTKPKFDKGDRVKVKDGTFAGMEGEVKELLEAKSLVRVVLTIFGRPVDVELEYWQVELV
jgi:transcriptional antiterminator NusG